MNAETFLADAETTPSAEQFLTDAPSAEDFLTEKPGAVAGTVNEFKRGLLAGQQQLLAAQLAAAPKSPSIRQLRRAYVTAMNDPKFGLALSLAGDDRAQAQRVEETLGPTAQVSRVVTAIEANRKAIADDIAAVETQMQNLPQSEALTEWSKADNSNWWRVLAKNPKQTVEIMAGIVAQSFPAMAPALAANLLAPGGVPGRVLASGAGSFGVESANAFLDSAKQTGYDFSDPEKVREFFDNPAAQAQARQFAAQRGLPIAVFDGLSAGLAGKFVGPALRQGTKKVLIGTGKEIALQAASGAAGEAAAQVVSGQKISAKDIVAEALGEIASGPTEALGNIREGQASRATPTTPDTGLSARPDNDELPPAPPAAEEFLQSTGRTPETTPRTENVPGATASTAVAPEQSSPSPNSDLPTPVPEDPRTIAYQMDALQNGKRSAVLITEGEAMPEVPGNFKTVTLEGYGTMIYNPRVHKEETIVQRAKEDKLGRILGYGVDRKPAPGTTVGVVTVRDPEGVEKQAVVTDQTSLDSVVKAAEKVAEPQDTVQLEQPEEVIADRRAETPTPNSQLPTPQVTESHLQQAREAVAQMRGEERPPDILDDLEANVGRGAVQFPADMQDALDASRERVAEALHKKPWKRLSSAQRKAIDKQLRVSIAEGLPADQALTGIGDKYAGLSADDFANAILDAGEARLLQRQKGDSKEVLAMAQEIAQAESEAGQANEREAVTDFDQAAEVSWADKIDATLTRAIEASDPWQQQRSGELHLFGLPKFMTLQAYNGMVRVIRATFRGTRSLAQAIQAGIDWLKTQNLPDFSETEIRAWLEAHVTVTPEDDDINVREFIDQLSNPTAGEPDIAQRVSNLLYERRTNESDAAFAARVMTAIGGPAQAVDVFTDGANGLPGSVRMMLGQLIIKAFGVAGQHDAAARFYDETFAAHITDTAQSLQALSAFLALTPEGKLIWARRKIERAAQTIAAPLKPQSDAAQREIEQANQEGIEAATASKDVQAAAREAVDAALEKQAATPGTELANAIRQEVLDGLVKAGLLTQREAEIAGLHYEGTADNSTLADKLKRAGIPLHDERATAINNLYKARTKAEREKIRSRARKARQQQTAKEAVQGDEAAVDLAINRAMRDLRVKFGQIIRQHHTQVDATGKTLAEKIAAASGLNEADARKLADAVQKRFAQLVTDRKRAALEKLLKPVPARTRPQLIERLISATNLGALSQERFWQAVQNSLDLPQWSNELAERIRKQVDVIERIPADQVERKQKAQIELLNIIERAKGVDFFDLGLAFYKTNLLTGLTTTLKNVASTAQAVMAEWPVQLLINPSLAPDWLILAGETIKNGMSGGVRAAADNWRTGMLTGSRVDKVQAGRVLELTQFAQSGGVPLRAGIGMGAVRRLLESDPGLPYLALWKPTTVTGQAVKNLAELRVVRFLNAWKYVTRGLGSQDMLFFKPSEEARAMLLALRLARSEGLHGEVARDKARQIMGYTQKAVATATTQAEAEGLTGAALKRRVAEILNANRPLELREDARDYALRATFNNHPYGMMGWIAEALNKGKAHEDPKIRVATNLMFPFTDIIANVVNAQLNFTPIGLIRAHGRRQILGSKLESLTVDQKAELQRELYVKAFLGTALLVGLSLKLAQYLDDEDPPLAIYGAGPTNDNDRRGLEAKGWISHSIKIGDRHWNYGNSTLAIPLAWLGNYHDRLRDARIYQDKATLRVGQDIPMMLAGVAAEGGLAITEQSFLTGMMQLNDILDANSAEQRGRAFLKLGIKNVTSGVIPNALRQVDRAFDPQVYEQRSTTGILVNNIPFVRGEKGQPALNALGMPVTRPLLSQFTSSQADADPIVKTLAETGNWPTLPNRNEIYPATGRTMTDAEYYDYVKGSGATARKELTALFAERGWRTLDTADQAKMISETVSLARQMWRADHGW